MKVLPINDTDDLEKKIIETREDYIGIEEMSITYIQPVDANGKSEEMQTLKITSNCACNIGLNDNENFYYDIEIPDGQHWSVYNGDSLKGLIDDFKKRLYGS